MNKIITGVICALALSSAATLQAQPESGEWEFTLGGSGASNQKFTRGGYGIAGSVGYFINDNLEVALRQNVNYDARTADDEWSGSTRAAADWHFRFDKFVPFVGANVGLDYNENDNAWGIGPELGFKYYVHPKTFILAMGEYRWSFDRFRDIDNNADDGNFVFTVGIGFNVGGRH